MEALVGIAIFAIISLGVYQSFILVARLVQLSRLTVDSAALATEEFEIIHNLPYADVGLVGGFVPGKIHPEQTLVRDNNSFLVETTIRSIDDPFDGTLGGTPNDTSPADYKLVELKISSPTTPRFAPRYYTEFIAPKNLENTSHNGALFVRVFNASGQPIEGANVHIVYNQATPPTSVDDTTNNNGELQLVDVPPGVNAYEVTVSKDGYSQDKTYPLGDPLNPNPVTPHATVAAQQVTQTSFSIDQVSNLSVESVTNNCQPVGNVAFHLAGAKQIGTDPAVLKFDQNFATDNQGQKAINNLEWDTYSLNLNDSVYDLAGAISPIPFSLAPGSTQDIKVAVALKHPDSVLISVKQGGSGLPLSGVEVLLVKDKFSQSLITGRGFLRQTDWSGGFGQETFTDPTKYFDSDENIETNDPAGELKLKYSLDEYTASGYLTSSYFDTGSASNFYQLQFLPLTQPWQTGADSVRLQIATNNDHTTWNFTGPDGTADTYYTAANSNINSTNNGHRYLRYRLYLSTASTTYTPDVGEVNFTFSSLCVPSGQVLFDGLEEGTYSLSVSKNGYQDDNEDLIVSSPWQFKEITLMPL